VFHSVDWSRATGNLEQHGEIDIVVVNQAGDVLLMEVKAGDVDFTPSGIFKTYGGQAKNVTAQVEMQYSALRGRLKDAGLLVRLNHLLVLPDCKVLTQTVQWPRDRIVDSEDIGRIVSRVTDLLSPGLPQEDIRILIINVKFAENRSRRNQVPHRCIYHSHEIFKLNEKQRSNAVYNFS
jgi:hypothetical protein